MKPDAPEPRPPRGRRDHMVFAIGLGVLLFNSPFHTWWLGVSPPWYLPYALWCLLILAIALSQFGPSRDD